MRATYVIVPGGPAVVIASMSGHRLQPLTVEQIKALATTPTEELLSLPFLSLDHVTDPLKAHRLSKRGKSLRVMAGGGPLGQARCPGRYNQPRHHHHAVRQ